MTSAVADELRARVAAVDVLGEYVGDAWITLAGLARETTSIRLGTLVTSATFRRPGPLAISVAQVDAMSGGRVEIGLGERERLLDPDILASSEGRPDEFAVITVPGRDEDRPDGHVIE